MRTTKSITLLILCLFWLTGQGHAQSSIHVDAEYISDIIRNIASDEFQGRETGTRGCEMAEDYFANELRKLGLKTAGDSGSYFHKYVIPNQEFSIKASLIIDGRTFYQGYNEDFSIVYKSAMGDVTGLLVYAGYGIYNPEKNRNDFDTLSLKGKIVVMKRGAPRNDIAGWMPSCIDSVKVAYCHDHGALGVMFYEPLIRTNQRILRPSSGNHLAMVSIIPDFPVFSVDERVVRYIFSQNSQSYYRINNLIDLQPSPFASISKCSMTATGKKPQSINARNVLGMIRGTDKQLRDEYIFIGGHVDHLGMDQSGKIWNGADDNASGPAVVLGIARAMVKYNFKPKRSIVFAAWTGEEMGLLGSKAWCEHPTIDPKKIVVYFNLDMVAVGNGKLNMPGTAFAPEITRFIRENLDTALLRKIVWSDGGPGGSDHSNFLNLGVPSFAGMTSGSHPDYHQSGDDAEKVDNTILQFTGDFVGTSAKLVADSRLEFNSTVRQEENLLRLFSFSFFDPIPSPVYKDQLKDISFKLGLVSLAPAKPSKDANDNFITLLSAFDQALEENSGVKYVLSTSAYDALMTRQGIMAAFNPADIQMDELKIKILANQGYRLAIIDKRNVICTDTAKLKDFIRICHETGIGIVLNNLPVPALENITSAAIDPCLITNTDVLSERIFENVKSLGHVVIYKMNSNDIPSQDIKNLNKLISLAGSDHVLVSPESVKTENLRYLLTFMKQYNESLTDKDLQYKLLGDNFYNFAVRSLQPNQ